MYIPDSSTSYELDPKLLPTTTTDVLPPSQPKPVSLTEDEIGWLKASEILLNPGPTEEQEDNPPLHESQINEVGVAPTCASGAISEFSSPEKIYPHHAPLHHHPQTSSFSEVPRNLQPSHQPGSCENGGSLLELATNAIGAAADLLTPSADPHLRSYKTIPSKTLPGSLTHRPSRPKLHALRVQSATLQPSHIPTPRRRLQSTTHKTWHRNRHYHLDGDEQEIDATQGLNQDKETENLPDVFSASSPSWLAEPSLNESEPSFDSSASTSEMLALIPCTSAPSNMSLNLPMLSTTPTTPTKYTGRPSTPKTPPSLGSSGRKEWIYRQPKQRTPLPSPSLKVSIVTVPHSTSPHSPTRTSPSVRPRSSPTSPSASRIPVRQRRASGLPKPSHQHIVGSYATSPRIPHANSIGRKTCGVHVSATSLPASPAPVKADGPETLSSANGGVTPVARPIHSVIPARPSLRRKTEDNGSNENILGKGRDGDGEKQEGAISSFWTSLKLRPRGGSLSYLTATIKKNHLIPDSMEENMASMGTPKEEANNDVKKTQSMRGVLRVPSSRRVASSALSQKILTGDEGGQEITTPTAPAPIIIPSATEVTVPPPPESPRIRSSSESSSSSARSHATSNTQHSTMSATSVPSTAPTSPRCSQPSLIAPTPKAPGASPTQMPARSILSRTPSTSSKAPPSLSGRHGTSATTTGGTASSVKSVTFLDIPTVHYASEDDSEGEKAKEPASQLGIPEDDVFTEQLNPEVSAEWPPVIEGRRGLKYVRRYWHDHSLDHEETNLGNTSIQEEDEDQIEGSFSFANFIDLSENQGGLKRLLSLTRKTTDSPPNPTLMRNSSTSSGKSRAKGARPSISGPFALGTLNHPSTASPSVSTPASFSSIPSSAPSSMLRYQQNSRSAANRSTTSLRSTLSIRSHTQSLHATSTTNNRRPHYQSHSYSHPPRAAGILKTTYPFINADSPASSLISDASGSPTTSHFPNKGSRPQKSPYSMSLKAATSVESLKSTAGRSVRSLSSVKSTASTRGFRAWLNKVGEGIGITTNANPASIDEDDEA